MSMIDNDYDMEYDEHEDLGDDFVTITTQVLVLIIYDASGSMNENGTSGKPKFKEAEEATNGFIQRLQTSRASSSFQIGLATFNDDVNEIVSPGPVTDLPDEDPVSLPTPKGNTNLDIALQWAEETSSEFMEMEGPIDKDARKISIVILSDGKVNRGDDPRDRGESLANKYKVAAGAFGNEAEEMLKDMVTSTDLFIRDPSPAELRNLLERSTRIATRS